MSPSLPIFNDFELLKLSELFELQLLTFVFDSVNKTSPFCFHDFFLLNSSVHHYSTRQASQGLYMSRKNSLQYGLSLFDILEPYFGMNYPWNSEMPHLKHYSKQN